MVSTTILYYNLMGPLLYMQAVIDSNIVMRRMTVVVVVVVVLVAAVKITLSSVFDTWFTEYISPQF